LCWVVVVRVLGCCRAVVVKGMCDTIHKRLFIYPHPPSLSSPLAFIPPKMIQALAHHPPPPLAPAGLREHVSIDQSCCYCCVVPLLPSSSPLRDRVLRVERLGGAALFFYVASEQKPFRCHRFRLKLLWTPFVICCCYRCKCCYLGRGLAPPSPRRLHFLLQAVQR